MNENTTISVEKWVETDEFDAPAVVYELTSALDTAKRARLREPIPEPFDATDFGFHEGYHADQWWVADEEIVFEGTIEPDTSLTTIVGVRTDDPDSLDPLLSRPDVEVAADEGDDCWGAVADEHVGFAVDGEERQAPAPATDGGNASVAGERPDEDESADASPDEHAAVQDSADTDSIESAIQSIDTLEEDGQPAETGWPVEIDGDELVDRFVEELAADSLSEPQRERLRSAIGVDSVTSMDARIEHCQQRLGDLAAYVDALETFLDEEGTGQQLIEDFREDVAAVETQLATLEADLDETTDEQTALRNRVDEIEDEVETLRSVREDVVSLESRFDETTTELRSEIDEIRSTVDRLAEWQRGVTSAFDDLQTTASES